LLSAAAARLQQQQQGRKKRDEFVEPSKFQSGLSQNRYANSASAPPVPRCVCLLLFLPRLSGRAFCPQNGAKTAQSYIWRAAMLIRMEVAVRGLRPDPPRPYAAFVLIVCMKLVSASQDSTLN